MSNGLTEAMAKVVEILSPLDSEQRKRVIHAAFALLGDLSPGGSTLATAAPPAPQTEAEASDLPSGISPTATAWLSKAKITREQLEQCLHFDGGKVQVIVLPGSATKRIDQVINTYLIRGFASYLETGDPSFSDQDARSLCEDFGCYDHTNHAKYLKEFGNRITGSKSSGWKLTAPGISSAGELVKR